MAVFSLVRSRKHSYQSIVSDGWSFSINYHTTFPGTIHRNPSLPYLLGDPNLRQFHVLVVPRIPSEVVDETANLESNRMRETFKNHITECQRIFNRWLTQLCIKCKKKKWSYKLVGQDAVSILNLSTNPAYVYIKKRNTEWSYSEIQLSSNLSQAVRKVALICFMWTRNQANSRCALISIPLLPWREQW